MRTLTARRVRRARRIIAADACAARMNARHRWVPFGGIWHRCEVCGEIS